MALSGASVESSWVEGLKGVEESLMTKKQGPGSAEPPSMGKQGFLETWVVPGALGKATLAALGGCGIIAFQQAPLPALPLNPTFPLGLPPAEPAHSLLASPACS